jgi:hypothetical protein
VLEAWGTDVGHAVIRAGGAPVSRKRKPSLRVGGTYHKEMMVLITTGGFTTICTSSNLLLFVIKQRHHRSSRFFPRTRTVTIIEVKAQGIGRATVNVTFGIEFTARAS